MIEIVNEPKPIEERDTKIPRNIRQVGDVSGNHVAYIEDYVYRFLHRGDRPKNGCCFIFLGEIKKQPPKNYVFIKGAIELTDISYGGGMPVFSEDVWDEIYRQTRQFFPQWKIVGWGLQTVGAEQHFESDIRKISSRHFPGNHGNVFIYDAYGEWEKMYMDFDGSVVPVDGFCIYYEKNTPMSHYLSAYHSERKPNWTEDSYRKTERFLVHDEMKYENEVRQDMEAMARYRAYMNGRSDKNHRQKSKIAVSVAMVSIIFLSGVLIQNYAKLSKMEDAVETISNREAVESAQEEIIQQTISKKATELAEAEEPVEEKKEETKENATEEKAAAENQAEQSSAQAEQNPYLSQGYYVVEKGDKLADISKKVYGTEDMVQSICQKNGIDNIDHIQAGDKLLLPEAP